MISIQSRDIGLKEKPFIIAEMSGNHNGSLDRAITLVDAAAEAGADAVKLQTYTADTLTLDLKSDAFVISDPGSLWYGKSLYELYSEASTPWEWHADIMTHAAKRGLICFSSPFDTSAVDFLESLGVAAYKIASAEVIDHALIQYVAETGKPIIISTGMATLSEIAEAVAVCHSVGNKNIALLQCTASYPASPENSNILTIPNMRETFGCEVGLSDHTMGILGPVVATVLGATTIEKHFILDKSIGGPDAHFSLDEKEFTEMVNAVRNAESMVGEVDYKMTEKKKKSRQFSRSLFIVKDVKAGEKITLENVRSIRPGFGMHPKYLSELLGKEFNQNIKVGEPLTFNLIKNG